MGKHIPKTMLSDGVFALADVLGKMAIEVINDVVGNAESGYAMPR